MTKKAARVEIYKADAGIGGKADPCMEGEPTDDASHDAWVAEMMRLVEEGKIPPSPLFPTSQAKQAEPAAKQVRGRIVKKGGPGSGNFGHAGRSGQEGGSAPSKGGKGSSGSGKSSAPKVDQEAATTAKRHAEDAATQDKRAARDKAAKAEFDKAEAARQRDGKKVAELDAKTMSKPQKAKLYRDAATHLADDDAFELGAARGSAASVKLSRRLNAESTQVADAMGRLGFKAHNDGRQADHRIDPRGSASTWKRSDGLVAKLYNNYDAKAHKSGPLMASFYLGNEQLTETGD